MSRKYFAKTFTRDKNHKNIEKRNDKPLKETRISKNVEKWGGIVTPGYISQGKLSRGH